MYKPFSDILDTDIGVGVVDIRPARNLAKLTQIIGKFEYLHNVDVLTGKYIIKDTELASSGSKTTVSTWHDTF